MYEEKTIGVMTCDQCGKIEEYEITPVRFGESLSFGNWKQVSFGKTILVPPMNSPMHGHLLFCSNKCLAEYFANHKDEELSEQEQSKATAKRFMSAFNVNEEPNS